MQLRKLQKQEAEVRNFISSVTVLRVSFAGIICLNLEYQRGFDHSTPLKLVGMRCVKI